MGLWLQPRDQTAVISVKRKHMCMPEGGRSGQEHDQECAHCFCLFACLLFVFQLSTLCSTVMSCDLPRKTSDAKCDTCHCASTQFTWRRQEAFGHVYTAIPPPYKLEFIQCYPLPQNKTEVMLFCLFEKIGCIPNVEMQMIKTGIPQSDPSVAGGLDIFIIPH